MTVKHSKKSSWKEQAQDLYAFAVDLARQPFFYTQYNVPDTPEGRYELLTLHLFLILYRLKNPIAGDPDYPQEISQEICDLMVADLDHSLRDLRLSDLKIARQFKQFIEGFYGRLVAYDDAIEKGPEHLQKALLRNIYGDNCVGNEAQLLTTYTMTQHSHFSTTSLPQLIKGEHHVPPSHS